MLRPYIVSNAYERLALAVTGKAFKEVPNLILKSVPIYISENVIIFLGFSM
jgi:hypothetical protein